MWAARLGNEEAIRANAEPAKHAETVYRPLSNSSTPKDSVLMNREGVPTFFMRMLRLSEAFLTNGDFLERVELSLSLRFICKDQAFNQTFASVLAPRSALASFSYPADVLALRAGGEGLGADDGVPPREGVLLTDIRSAFFRSNYRAALGQQRADHAGLLIDLETENAVK